jgi:hypothetical protein
MEKTEYTDKLAAAKDKVAKTMKQSIAELKEFIKKRDEFYSQDVKEMDFKELEALGNEMEAVITRAAAALNAKEGAALIGELDRSVAKMRKVEDVQDKIRVAKAEESKAKIADMIMDGQ